MFVGAITGEREKLAPLYPDPPGGGGFINA